VERLDATPVLEIHGQLERQLNFPPQPLGVDLEQFVKKGDDVPERALSNRGDGLLKVVDNADMTLLQPLLEGQGSK